MMDDLPDGVKTPRHVGLLGAWLDHRRRVKRWRGLASLPAEALVRIEAYACFELCDVVQQRAHAASMSDEERMEHGANKRAYVDSLHLILRDFGKPTSQSMHDLRQLIQQQLDGEDVTPPAGT